MSVATDSIDVILQERGHMFVPGDVEADLELLVSVERCEAGWFETQRTYVTPRGTTYSLRFPPSVNARDALIVSAA